MAMIWLLDDDGEVRREYAADYVGGGRTVATEPRLTSDYRDAFANLAPAV
jgi:hypothetical protein